MPQSTPRWNGVAPLTLTSHAPSPARYDRASSRVIVDLENGCTVAFPPRLAQGLEAASDDQLAAVEILGRGYGLHWEELDVDISLPGLMAGIFGTKAWMARRGGRPGKTANR